MPTKKKTIAAKAAREILARRKARRSLLDFILYLKPDYIVSDFSRQLCAELDQFIIDMMDEKRPVLVVAAPPQHGKSEIVSRYLPAYIFGLYPHLRLAGLSYNVGLASQMNTEVQAIMLSHKYGLLFPDSQLSLKRVVSIENAAKRNSYEFDIVGNSGRYISQGIGGGLTGKSVDLGIIDDPIKNAKEALSPTTKKSIKDWYGSTFLTRLSKNSGQIIMATRWAKDDLSGHVLETYPNSKYLVFQAIDEKGNALVPELHPIEKLLETKRVLGDYFWSAMYMQSPKTIGGTVFKDSGVKYYHPHELPKRFDQVIHSWDMTFKDTEGTDFVVGQVWAKSGANVYLLHQVRERMGFTETSKAVVKMQTDYPDGRAKLVEDKANGPAIIDHLKGIVSGLVPINPDGSKVARAHAASPEWEAGNVYLPHPSVAPWITDFVDNVTTFPACAHDDEIDAMTQALRYLYGRIKKLMVF